MYLPQKENQIYNLYDYRMVFANALQIIHGLIAEGKIKEARIILIMDILYAIAYNQKDGEENIDVAKKIEELDRMSTFELFYIYTRVQKRIGLGPTQNLTGGQSYLDRVISKIKSNEAKDYIEEFKNGNYRE